jgi:hypothetical protein
VPASPVCLPLSSMAPQRILREVYDMCRLSNTAAQQQKQLESVFHLLSGSSDSNKRKRLREVEGKVANGKSGKRASVESDPVCTLLQAKRPLLHRYITHPSEFDSELFLEALR